MFSKHQHKKRGCCNRSAKESLGIIVYYHLKRIYNILEQQVTCGGGWFQPSELFILLLSILLLSFIPHLQLVLILVRGSLMKAGGGWREPPAVACIVAEMQHSCHGLNDLKPLTYCLLGSVELYSLMLKAVLCLDPTPCNILYNI